MAVGWWLAFLLLPNLLGLRMTPPRGDNWAGCLGMTLGLLVFLYARKLFGMAAGLFALAFSCLEPTILAHGRIVHTDVPGALAYLQLRQTVSRWRQERAAERRAAASAPA